MRYSSLKYLLFIAIILLLFANYCPTTTAEGFASLLQKSENFPQAVSDPILNDYPLTHTKHVSAANASQIWVDYPVFRLGSYEQITNNFRYWKNPDDGQCSRAEMCNALYKDKSVPSNQLFPLPEAEEGTGARVNYYRAEPNDLFYSIPTNENILY